MKPNNTSKGESRRLSDPLTECDWTLIDFKYRSGVRLYVETGNPIFIPDGYVHELLSGNRTYLEANPNFATFLRCLPVGCHGSPRAIREWQQAGGLYGLLRSWAQNKERPLDEL